MLPTFSTTGPSGSTRSTASRPGWPRDGRQTALWVVIAFLSVVILVFLAIGNNTNQSATDPSHWMETARQEFSQPADRGNIDAVYGADMRGYSGFTDTSGFGLYSPDQVLSVADGALDFFLHSESGRPRVASVVPFGYTGQVYGRYSLRFRYDKIPGYKVAVMLWPVSDRWSDGEIDWPEGELNAPLYGASAVVGSSTGGKMRFDPPHRTYAPDGPGGWHVATVEWTPGKVQWFWDDRLVGETTDARGVPTERMRLTIQTETADRANENTPGPDVSGHLQVDWVVQYAYRP